MSEEVRLLQEAKAKLETYRQARIELSSALAAVDDYMQELASVRAEIQATLADESPAASAPTGEAEVTPAKPVAEAKPKRGRKAADKASSEVEPALEPEETPVPVEEEPAELDLFGEDEPAQAEENKTEKVKNEDDTFDFDQIEF